MNSSPNNATPGNIGPNTDKKGVSIIVKVDSLEQAEKVFMNYILYAASKKELILVHNGDPDSFDRWLELSLQYPMTRIYRQYPENSCEACLNYCIDRAIFQNIVIWDEEGRIIPHPAGP